MAAWKDCEAGGDARAVVERRGVPDGTSCRSRALPPLCGTQQGKNYTLALAPRAMEVPAAGTTAARSRSGLSWQGRRCAVSGVDRLFEGWRKLTQRTGGHR